MGMQNNSSSADGCADQAAAKHKQGVSSIAMHDPSEAFAALALKPGDCFLDMGCGAGDYALRAARIVGTDGLVFALDKWSEVVSGVDEKIKRHALANVRVMTADITGILPVSDSSVDVCWLCMVLHVPEVRRNAINLAREARRVLKKSGRLAVLEIKKEPMPFGPPQNMRLAPEETAALVKPYGFARCGFRELGCSYLIQFKLDERRNPALTAG